MNKLKKLRKIFKTHGIDGYIVPKNDEFFGEYVDHRDDRLEYISSFSGSAGYSLALMNKAYLFVDGRYTAQAKIQSKKKFKIITIPNRFPHNILKNKKLHIGFDPKLHTEFMLSRLFKKSICSLGKSSPTAPTHRIVEGKKLAATEK